MNQRFIAHPRKDGTGYVLDTKRGNAFEFDSYTAAKDWAEIANRTPC